MVPQGCFQFEGDVSVGITLFFIIAEGGETLALDQPGAITELDIQQRYRAVTNGANHFAAFPHGLDDVVNEFILGHVNHRSQPAGYENGIILAELADFGHGLCHLQLGQPLTIEEDLIEFVVLVRPPVQWGFSPFDAVDVDVIALPPEGDVRMRRFGQEVTRGPFFGADLCSTGHNKEDLLFHDKDIPVGASLGKLKEMKFGKWQLHAVSRDVISRLTNTYRDISLTNFSSTVAY